MDYAALVSAILVGAVLGFMLSRRLRRRRTQQQAEDALRNGEGRRIGELLEHGRTAEALEAARRLSDAPATQAISSGLRALVRLHTGEIKGVAEGLERELREGPVSRFRLEVGLQAAYLLDNQDALQFALFALASVGTMPAGRFVTYRPLADDETNFHHALYALRMGEMEKAQRYYRLYTNIRRNKPMFTYNQALFLIAKGDFRSALGKLEETRMEELKSPLRTLLRAQHANAMAWCHYKLGDLPKAEREARRAMEIFEFCLPAYYTLSRVLADQGDRAEARVLLEKASVMGHRPSYKAQLAGGG